MTDQLDQNPPGVPPVPGRASKNRVETNPAGARGQMTTETGAIAGHAGEAEALALIMLPGFSSLTAAQQAAFEAGAQPGQAFSTMTAAQQAAYLAANNAAPAAASPFTLPSMAALPSWVMPVSLGVLAIFFVAHARAR